MKEKNYRIYYSVILFLFLFPVILMAQGSSHELVIPPPTGPGIFLNAQIMADSNADGTRKDPERVYVLERDGEYLVNALIRNTGWVLRIKAKDGPGKKPIIYLFPSAVGGNPPGQFVDVRGNLWLKNLIISGYYEPDASYLGNLQGALFNMGSPGFDIVIDSCLLTNTNGNHVRTDNAPRLVKITNTIFGNMGYLGRSNLGAGKAIDVRAGSVDSLVIMNCTFMNWQDRIIRHYQSSAPIKVLRFEHNTLVNGMSFHGLLSLGKLGYTCNITNNLIYDGFALGNDTDATRQAEFKDSGELDAFGGPRMTWVIANPSDTTVYKIKNNYYCISTVGQKFLTDNGLTEGDKLTWYINKKLGADSTKTFTKTDITLPKISNLMVPMMNWYRSPTGANKTKATTGWVDYDRRTIQFYTDTMNCAYPTTHAAYTGGLGGYPVGDLNWFPTKLAAWLKDPVSDVKKVQNIIPESFSLEQNYPNPFNPSTIISYNLPKESFVTLIIYNSIGQEVCRLVDNQKHTAGKYDVQWDSHNSFGKLMPSGVYFYQIISDGFMMSKKMMLLK